MGHSPEEDCPEDHLGAGAEGAPRLAWLLLAAPLLCSPSMAVLHLSQRSWLLNALLHEVLPFGCLLSLPPGRLFPGSQPSASLGPHPSQSSSPRASMPGFARDMDSSLHSANSSQSSVLCARGAGDGAQGIPHSRPALRPAALLPGPDTAFLEHVLHGTLGWALALWRVNWGCTSLGGEGHLLWPRALGVPL